MDVRGIAQRIFETAYARPQLHDLSAKWRSFSLIKGGQRVPEEKQDLCARMVRVQPRSQSSQEPVDYYEG